MDIKKVIVEKKCTVIDVRTPIEWEMGHLENSINIPLSEIPSKISYIQNLLQPIVVCCASGTRSATAKQHLSGAGIVCINGGAWSDLV